ncbi:Fe-S cluster assembly ATPase SufC [Candidatus Pacearchaeota archaeon]|nr:Fe-S cluster assembly ATPase SufC [Candidatus Pacearchaeota archaeon]
MLEIKNLHVSIDDKPVLNGVDLKINSGEVHAMMGPNGAGKSTLTNVIMGHPKYTITQGDILFNGKSILDLEPHERSLMGLFLAFQHPKEIGGITLEEFLLAAYRAKQKHLHPDNPPVLVFRFKKMLKELMEKFKMEKKFASRYLNQGFSGGEKKKSEMLQMAVLKPSLAIMDETDSGLDVDALKAVCDGIQQVQRDSEKPMGVLMITHYQRILKHLEPDHVHVLKDGKIIQSGGKEFAHELEKNGYENL